MRQRFRSHLTFANVCSLAALFVALGGTAAAAVVVSSNSQIGPGTVSGHKPPSGDHANIIAGSVNGQDVADNSLSGADITESSLTGDVQKLTYNAAVSGSSPKTKIATVGPYTIKGQCSASAPNVIFRLYANGPAGTADLMFDETEDDNTDFGTHSNGLLIPANTDTEIVQAMDSFPDYQRIAGTAMLKTGSTLVQVDFNAVADARNPDVCLIYGTATRAT